MQLDASTSLPLRLPSQYSATIEKSLSTIHTPKRLKVNDGSRYLPFMSLIQTPSSVRRLSFPAAC
jgi:hypothetical protein